MRIYNFPEGQIIHGECVSVMKWMKKKKTKVDLIVGSPPYEDVRTYGKELDFRLKGQAWVDWMVEVYEACLGVCDGLVALVIGHGKHSHKWSGTPMLLGADLIRKGICLRSPVFYKRVGIPGSGGQDWLAKRIEFIICASNTKGELPYSNLEAIGHKPLYKRGGRLSHRTKSGRRVMDAVEHRKDGSIKTRKGVMPKFANPGNVIDVGAAGGGRLGSKIAYDNDAPFPDKIPKFFIKGFCPPKGVVLDPFGGSGTTMEVAMALGMQFIVIDIRESQIELMLRRYDSAKLKKGLLL